MCDTNNQLPNAVPVFYQRNGRFFLAPPYGVIYAGAMEVVVDYPRYVPFSFPAPKSFRVQPETLEALKRLHALADELARLTRDMKDEQQKGVWDAYYALHGALTGAPEGGQ